MTLSSRGLGHRPFTAVTGVRIPLGTPKQKTPSVRAVFLFQFTGGTTRAGEMPSRRGGYVQSVNTIKKLMSVRPVLRLGSVKTSSEYILFADIIDAFPAENNSAGRHNKKNGCSYDQQWPVPQTGYQLKVRKSFLCFLLC